MYPGRSKTPIWLLDKTTFLKVASATQKVGSENAVALRVAEQYIEAFRELAKKTNTILLPVNTGDTGSMIAQALAVFETIKRQLNDSGSQLD